MKVSRGEVVDAILTNNTTRVTEMLEGFDLLKDGTPPHFTSADKDLVTTMLSFASAMLYRGNLDDSLAEELVERTAMTVNIFPFLKLVMTTAGIEQIDDPSVIPEEIRVALSREDYTDKIARTIEELDDETFGALIAFIMTDKVEQLHVKFNLPIMRHIYAEGTIPTDLMFAYMGLCPRQTVDEPLGNFRDAVGVLGGLGLLDILFGVAHGDDDGKGGDPEGNNKKDAHECHCGGCHGGCDGCHGCHSDD